MFCIGALNAIWQPCAGMHIKESFKYLGVNAEPDKVDDDWLAQFGTIVVHF